MAQHQVAEFVRHTKSLSVTRSLRRYYDDWPRRTGSSPYSERIYADERRVSRSKKGSARNRNVVALLAKARLKVRRRQAD